MRSSVLLWLSGAVVSASAEPCIITEYAGIAAAVSTCSEITLRDIYAPENSSIDLSGALPGSVITFAGTTTFAFTNSSTFKPIVLGGSDITVTGEEGHIIDGNGQAYWDGLGSNGGVPKPNTLISISYMNNSVIENLNVQSYPVRCFSAFGATGLTMRNIHVNNSAGYAPNERSDGLDAAHNSDAFGFGTQCKNITLSNSTVYNQDDCVAITAADSVTVSDMYCSGSHGISIGSIGGKTYNNVTNILLKDSVIANSSNGVRIKTNFNTTGYVANVTYQNIILQDITDMGLDLQQDYLNGGPTGEPSNGVIVENILFKNITGTVTDDAIPVYVLCGDGSCTNVVFEDVHITGGNGSSCNFPASGCPV